MWFILVRIVAKILPDNKKAVHSKGGAGSGKQHAFCTPPSHRAVQQPSGAVRGMPRRKRRRDPKGPASTVGYGKGPLPKEGGMGGKWAGGSETDSSLVASIDQQMAG